MNIKQFVEQSEREFGQKFPDMYGILPNSIDFRGNKGLPVHSDAIKSFTSSKLRELIGKVRREIEEKIIEEKTEYIEFGLQSTEGKIEALREVVELLDEAGGEINEASIRI